jgi:hypothetical protein
LKKDRSGVISDCDPLRYSMFPVVPSVSFSIRIPTLFSFCTSVDSSDHPNKLKIINKTIIAPTIGTI